MANIEEAKTRIKAALKEHPHFLDLGGLGLEKLPAELWEMTAVQNLILEGNNLTALAPEIGRLTKVEALWLKGNKLNTLPDEIGNCAAMWEIDLSNNELTALPSSIHKWTKLYSLTVSNNQLELLPDEITNLTDLEILHLDHNRLKSLPKDLRKLQKLYDLDISFNLLDQLPDPKLHADLDTFNLEDACLAKPKTQIKKKRLTKAMVEERDQKHLQDSVAQVLEKGEQYGVDWAAEIEKKTWENEFYEIRVFRLDESGNEGQEGYRFRWQNGECESI